MRTVNYPGVGQTVVYNTDNEMDLARLYERSQVPPTMRQVIERDFEKKPVGAIEGIPAAGPIMETLDVLIAESDFKVAIEEAHSLKLFPVYHSYKSWAPNDGSFTWDQDGLGYCWTWSGTGMFLALRAALGLKTVFCSPVSMGYLVSWKNRGNYLESWLKGAMEDGMVPIKGGEFEMDDWPDVSINSTNRSSSFWGKHDAARKDFRLDRVWDIDTRSGELRNIQETLTSLYLTCPIYGAHNYWSHALGHEAMFWDERAPHNITIGHRNSHNNKDLIILEGTKATFDEAYPFISVKGGDY